MGFNKSGVQNRISQIKLMTLELKPEGIAQNPTAAPPKPHARAPCGRSLLPLVGTGRRPSALRGPGARARARARAKYTRKSRNLNFLLGQPYFRPRQKLFSFSSLATVQNQKLIRADFEKLWSIWSKQLKNAYPFTTLNSSHSKISFVC